MDIQVKCDSCKKPFLRSAGKAHEAEKFGWRQFCSTFCLAESRKLGQELSCGNPTCGSILYRSPKDIRKVQNSYCSRACAARVNNQRFPKRVRKTKQCERKDCGKSVTVSARYCSRSCYSADRKAHTPAELIEKLQFIASELGRTPARREALSIVDACVWAFGSWNNSLRVAGLTPHRSHSQRMFKRTNTVALDGHTCDSISEAIIDNWLTRNGVSHIRNAPYPETGCKADWGIEGSVFVEYFGLAHDSPRYDRSIQKKRALCKKYGIRLIEIYAEDLYPAPRFEEKFKGIKGVPTLPCTASPVIF